MFLHSKGTHWYIVSLILAFDSLAVQAQNLRITPPLPSEDSRFGYSVASIGDLTGDGIDEIVIAEPFHDHTANPSHSKGVVYVFDGSTQEILHTLTSPASLITDTFGYSVASVPDVDGDGHMDVLIGSPGEGNSHSGIAYLFSSATAELLVKYGSPTPTANGQFGAAVAGLPDVDGDGRGDVIIGAPYETTLTSGTYPGRAHVFSGAIDSPIISFRSPTEFRYGRFGTSVAALPDFDGDGLPDIAVGAPEETSSSGQTPVGRVHLFAGPKFDRVINFYPPTPWAHGGFGKVLASVPDFNGDGRDDLVVGAPDDEVGTVYTFASTTGEPWLTIVEPYKRGESYFGSAVAGVRDVDGDGRGDIVVGSKRGNPFTYQADTAGHVYAFSGSNGRLLAAVLSPRWQISGQFGSSLAPLTTGPFGDQASVMVGATNERINPEYPESGQVYLIGFDCNENGLPDAEDVSQGLVADCNNNFTIDSCERDCNGNFIPDECDMADGNSIDCNSNGYPDECDIASGLSADCDGDGRADICERDCNRNHIADECEIAAGTVEDCNHNGVPDRCDLDCNSNHIPDECEIAQGLLPDCNRNGRPDSCDIRYYSSHDTNSNGVPDECEPDCNINGVADYQDVRPRADFLLETNMEIGAGPDQLVAADIDGDSDLDLLFANEYSNRITILLNDGAGHFMVPIEVRTDRDPRALVATDLNGDGFCDLAVETFYDSTVMVFLSTGNHPLTLADPQRISVGRGPISLAAGDLDSDGDIDLVTVNMWGGTVSILQNDGTGSFCVSKTLTPHYRPVVAEIADFDGDGDLDLAVSNSASDDVSIFRNRGDATFEAPVNYPAGSWPIFMAGADLDGDGDLDLAVGASGGITILTNVGHGLFERTASYGLYLLSYYMFEAMTISAADLDLDGDLDLALSSMNGMGEPAFGILWNRGNGAFEWGKCFGPEATYEFGVTGDFDGDGDIDFAVDDLYQDRLLLFFNETIPSPTSDCNVNGVPDSCETPEHDCNANGLLDECDIATATSLDCDDNGIPDECELAKEDCNFNGVPDACDVTVKFDVGGLQRYSTNGPPLSIAEGDYDGDGDVDIAAIIYSPSRSALQVFLNDSTGHFIPSSLLQTNSDPVYITAADFDQDGDVDIMATGYDGDFLSMYSNRGDGTFEPPVTVAHGDISPMLIAADMNNDGKPDIVAAEYSGIFIWIVLNAGGGAFSPPEKFYNGDYAYSLACGDINGDGFVDVIANNTTLASVMVYFNLGTTTFGDWLGLTPPIAVPAALPGHNSPYVVGLADIDVDGRLDLLAVDGEDSLVVFMNKNNETFVRSQTIPMPYFPVSLNVCHLNGDKLPDIVAPVYIDPYDNNDFSKIISVVINRGQGMLSPRRDIVVGLSPIQVVVGDMDGDGRPDIVTDNIDSSDWTVLFNRTNPAFSGDCNTNGVPDECESSGDCNGNQVPDICEIDFGENLDCNHDGILDQCKPCGDLTGEGIGDGADFAVLLSAYGHMFKEPEYNSSADLDSNGTIDLADYQIWVCCYRAMIGSPSARPPQPTNVGDMNRDGKLDGRDVRGFLDVYLSDPPADLPGSALADLHYDGVLNGDDLDEFVADLLATS